MSTAPLRLVTRADDIGSFRSANRAALDCVDKGILRNVSLIANAAHLDHAAQLMAGRCDICFGHHMTICCEWPTCRWRPVAPPDSVPNLVRPDGTLFASPQEVQDHGVDFDQIIIEMQAQLDCLRCAGFKIAYCETHMSFDWLFEGNDDTRRLEQYLERWASEQGLWFNTDNDRVPRFGQAPGDASDPVSRLLANLRTHESGTYMVVGHPWYNDNEVAEHCVGPRSGNETMRDLQRRLFVDPEIVEYCRTHAVHLARFDEL